MTTDNELIDRIVRGVLDTLQTPPVAVRSPSAPVAAVDETAKAEPAKAAPPVNELRLTETVITGELLESNWKQLPRVAVASKAILTPSARDFLNKHKIEVIRTGSRPAANPAKPGSSTAAPAVETNSAVRWRVFVVQSHPQLDRVLEDATRGTSTKLDRVVPGSVNEATAAAITALTRAEIDGGILLTHQTLVAACKANRNAKVRAAAIRTVADLNEARRQLAPNLICLDPAGKSYFELRNLLKTSTTGPAPKAPASWTD
ncbi:MAG: hypothetical protein IT428_20845 [Planctomycetaceae bacterium]|nr:hypothetical protein [Planctomycetaceae bacterium]